MIEGVSNIINQSDLTDRHLSNTHSNINIHILLKHRSYTRPYNRNHYNKKDSNHTNCVLQPQCNKIINQRLKKIWEIYNYMKSKQHWPSLSMDQRINHMRNEKILWEEWKQKHNISKHTECSSSSAYSEMYSGRHYIKKTRSQIINLTFHFKEPEKEEQTKTKASMWKQTIIVQKLL